MEGLNFKGLGFIVVYFGYFFWGGVVLVGWFVLLFCLFFFFLNLGFYYQSFVKHFPKLYIDMAQTVGYFCLFTCTKVKALELLELRNSFG